MTEERERERERSELKRENIFSFQWAKVKSPDLNELQAM